MQKLFISILLLSLCNFSIAEFKTAKMSDDAYSKTRSINKEFLIYEPKNFKSKEETPLLIFLHGMGKRGTNVSTLKGMAKYITKHSEKHSVLTVLPQCLKNPKTGKGWWNSNDLNIFLEQVKKTYKIDENRIYLCGFSMGGFGTWAWAMDKPKTFAAIAPMAGGGDVKKVKVLKDLPIWAFHGKKDTTVKYEKTKVLIDALKKVKSEKVEFTSYPDEGHGIVMDTLKNPKLYEWFFKQSL